MVLKTIQKEPIKFDWKYNKDDYIKEHEKVKSKGFIDVLKGIVKRYKRKK